MLFDFLTHPSVLSNCLPASMDKHPAPPPNPYPFGPYFLPWQFLQYNSLSCSAQLVESNIFPHIPVCEFVYLIIKICNYLPSPPHYINNSLSILIRTAFETLLVEFVSTSNAFLSGIHGLAAFWAFWIFDWLERHFYRRVLLKTLIKFCRRKKEKENFHLSFLFILFFFFPDIN